MHHELEDDFHDRQEGHQGSHPKPRGVAAAPDRAVDLRGDHAIGNNIVDQYCRGSEANT